MKQCISVKTRLSTERCPRMVRHGVLCSVHAARNSVIVWADVTRDLGRLCKAQALARGWLLRRFQACQGPGLRDRSSCTNEEDMMTGESIADIDAKDYFGLREGDKTFGFHIEGLLKWTFGNDVPSNPYTRTPLNAPTCQRLRACIRMREALFKHSPWGHLLHHKTATERAMVIIQELDNELKEVGFRSADDPPLNEMPTAVYALASIELNRRIKGLPYSGFLQTAVSRLNKPRWETMNDTQRGLVFGSTWLGLLRICPIGLRDRVMGLMTFCITFGYYMVYYPLRG